MDFENRPKPKGKISIFLAIVVLVGVCAGIFVIGSSIAKLGSLQTIAIVFGYLAGTIFGQAKDIANRQTSSGNPWQDCQTYFIEAWSNQHAAAFIFRSMEWGGLFIAGTLIATIFVSPG